MWKKNQVKQSRSDSLVSVFKYFTTLLHRSSHRAQFHACRNVNPHQCQLRIAEGRAIKEALTFMIISKLIKV